MAGSTITMWKQRARTVRFNESEAHEFLQPISEDVAGGLEVNEKEEDDSMFYPDHLDEEKSDAGTQMPDGHDTGKGGIGERNEMEELNEKYQELKNKVDEYFDDENGQQFKTPPIVKAPTKPTREEYERHQTTHTPYAAWCKHCIAARAVRHMHPSKGRQAIVVPDIETGKGPTKVSIDYMYLHERRGRDKDIAHNPPHMIMIEHRSGRCWAYRVPNKGVLEEAHWLAERMVKDLDDAGLRHEKIQLKSA